MKDSDKENGHQMILPWKYQSVILQYFKEKEYVVGLDLLSAFLKIKNYAPPRYSFRQASASASHLCYTFITPLH